MITWECLRFLLFLAFSVSGVVGPEMFSPHLHGEAQVTRTASALGALTAGTRWDPEPTGSV